MSESEVNIPDWLQKIPDWLHKQMDDSMPKMKARDYIYCLQMDFDIDAQLAAINTLLNRNQAAEKTLAEEIKQAEDYAQKATGSLNEYACDQHIDLCHSSVYQDAAHSMAAVGMLAPLIETIFYQSFLGIRAQFFSLSDPSNQHSRWATNSKNQWDCHWILAGRNWKKDLVKGIVELSAAVGVGKHWPSDLHLVLSALFVYRNAMFHNGLEWPIVERKKFAQRMSEENWPSKWFAKATSGGEPWAFYLTDDFIMHAFETIERILVGFGTFIRDELISNQSRP